MNNKNNGLRRSSRFAAILSAAGLVGACQSFGPVHAAPAPPVPVAAAVIWVVG